MTGWHNDQGTGTDAGMWALEVIFPVWKMCEEEMPITPQSVSIAAVIVTVDVAKDEVTFSWGVEPGDVVHV